MYITAKPRVLKEAHYQYTTRCVAYGAFRTSPILSLQNFTNESPLSKRRAQITVKYTANVATNKNHLMFSHMLTDKLNNNLKLKDNTPPHNLF